MRAYNKLILWGWFIPGEIVGTVLQLGHRTGVLRVLKALQSENMCVSVYPAKQLDKSRNYRLPLKHHVSSS